MPKLHAKRTVLRHRLQVISYERDPAVFYGRELIEGTKRYRTWRLGVAANLDEAVALLRADLPAAVEAEVLAHDAADPPAAAVVAKPDPLPIETTIHRHLHAREARVRAGSLKPRTLNDNREVLLGCALPFFEHLQLSSTDQLSPDTFASYRQWRMEHARGRWHAISGITKLTLTKELAIIKAWIRHHLLQEGLVDQAVLDAAPLKMPRLENEDLLANPAISPGDWQQISGYIESDWLVEAYGIDNYRAIWSRQMLWHWIQVAKASGARPEELQQLRWGEVQFHPSCLERVDVVLWSAKTGEPRISSCSCAEVLMRWKHFVLQWQQEHGVGSALLNESFVWGNPYRDGAPLSLTYLREMWIAIRRELADVLSGHLFSPKPYTLYSLRSTYIEERLLSGSDPVLVAKEAGHSVASLARYAERLDPRRKSQGQPAMRI
jgi:integrase